MTHARFNRKIQMLLFCASAGSAVTGCSTGPQIQPYETSFVATQSDLYAGGMPAIVLKQLEPESTLGNPKAEDKKHLAHLEEAVVLPGVGMQVSSIRAHLPGQKAVALLSNTPSSVLVGELPLKQKMDRVELATGLDHARLTSLVTNNQDQLIAVTTRLSRDRFQISLIVKNESDRERQVTMGWQPELHSSFKFKTSTKSAAEWIHSGLSLGIRVKMQSAQQSRVQVKQLQGSVRFLFENPSVASGESVASTVELELFQP